MAATTPPQGDSLADLPLRELLARLADGAPAPAGGSATAVACALAAALMEMTATLSLARPERAERHPRMREVRLGRSSCAVSARAGAA